jgi:hypothetical protein
MQEHVMPIGPATRLEDVHKTLSPEPLTRPDEFRAFYREEVNRLRGGDTVGRLELGLRRAHGGSPYKSFLMGHPGVGRSTELTRLVQRVEPSFRAIRFSATTELDPVAFKPFDVLLLMMAEAAERTARPIDLGGAGQPPSEERLKEIWGWFASEETTISQARSKALEVAGGMGGMPDSWWAKVLGLFGTLRGEVKYASVRERTIVEYRLSRLSDLIEVTNRLLDECNEKMRRAARAEWLFIGEDFDKAGMPPGQIENLFLTYANVFKELRAHMVFTIPIELGYARSAQLPFPSDRVLSIPDTPVFQPDHSAHHLGREAVSSILRARVCPELFAEAQMMRLIVASGGNLRDLFALVCHAADTALLRKAEHDRIQRSDADAAIDALRTEYERRLGRSSYDRDDIPYESKADLLVRIYNQDQTARIPDPALYSLLRARAVQEFDTTRWFGVHPLVVDVLTSQDRIPPSADGAVPGGTR